MADRELVRTFEPKLITFLLKRPNRHKLMNSNLILKNGKPDRYLFNGGYCSYPANPVASSRPTFHYYTKDHLGNNRTVVNENGTLEQVTHYYPFGGIFGEATLNAGIQPYKYNGKEFDHVHGLNWYDYGARQYDPILARWDRIDPLAEKYYGVSPYTYCIDNPINAIDLKGKEVYAMSPDAIRNICNTLSNEERTYVHFLPNGLLDATLLNNCNSTSNNFSALKLLSNSETKYYFNVGEKDMEGKAFYEKGTLEDAPDNYRYGVTLLPGAENSPSPDEDVYIYTASFLSDKMQARNTAHEAYGHAYFYELSKLNPVYNPNHTRGVTGYATENDPVFGSYIVPILGQTNSLLEEQIKKVEQEAINNYENSH